MLDPEILALDGRAPRIDVWAQLDQDYAIVVGAGSELADDLDLDVWVQDEHEGDLRQLDADGPDAQFSATITPLGASNGIRVVFPAGQVTALDPAVRHWIAFASGGQILAVGRFRPARTGRLGDGSEQIALAVGSSSLPLQVVTLDRSDVDGPGGAGIPEGEPGQMLRFDGDGELEAVTPNQAGAPLRANENGHLPDVNLSAEVVRQGEMESAIAAAIDALDAADVSLAIEGFDPDTVADGFGEVLNALEGQGAAIGQLLEDVEGLEGGGVQVLSLLHLTNLDLSVPHPLGGFLPPNTRIAELVGQDDPDENGTYRTPADPATEPLVLDDDQLLVAGNRGHVVTVQLVVSGAGFRSGAFHFQVLTVPGAVLALRHGVQWFAQWRTEADPTGPVTIPGASFGHQVLVTGQIDDTGVGGLYVYMGAGEVMLRSGVFAPEGSIVYVMTEDTRWTLTPHAGWVPAGAAVAAAGNLPRGTAEAVALLADHSARVEFPGTAAPSGGLSSDSPGDVFTDGYEIRSVIRPDYRTTGSRFSEFGSQSLDGTGSLDAHEAAIVRGDPAFPITYPDPEAAYLFFEGSADGLTEIANRLNAKLSSTWGQWCEVMVRVDYATGTVSGWERVSYERQDGGVYVTSTVDGAVFRQVGQVVDAAYESPLVDGLQDWWIGHNLFGGWRRTVWRNGADGDLIDDVRVEDIDGTTFTSTGGRTWTVGAGVTVVADAETRLDALEALPAPLPVGTTAGTVAAGDDARLSDARTPTAHTHAASDVTSGTFDAARIPASVQPFAYTKAAPSGEVAYSNLGTFGTASTTHGLTAANRRIWVPIYVRADTYTRIGLNVTIGATATWRLGLHADDGGWPAAAPIADFGTIDMSGSAGRRDITISQALATGWYWAQVQVDAYTANPTVTAVVGLNGHPVMPLGFPTDRANAGRSRSCLRDTAGAGGALGNAPASLATSGVSLENDAPRIWIWRA